MKVYISVDIEGITGVTSWAETELNSPDHAHAAKQMKEEALAACRGAIEAGATEIWVHDSHDSGMNMWIDEFPKEVKLIRNWMYIPDSMVAGIDETFDACLCIGYHSEGGVNCNPLAHTMTHTGLFWVKINGELVSELEHHTLACAKYGVPMVFVSGDKGLCDKAEKVIPGIVTVPTKEGRGGATINRNPKVVCDEITEKVKEALLKKHEPTPDKDQKLVMEICYREHMDANKASYYPGVELVDAHTVRYEAKNIEDYITTFYFIH